MLDMQRRRLVMKHTVPLILVLLFAVRTAAQDSNPAKQVAGVEAAPRTASSSAITTLVPSQIFSRARPSVVIIVASDQNGQREALGSGFVVSHGKIATNHHVVEGMNQAYIVFSDGAVKPISSVVADSIQQDLIILAVETGNRPPLPFGDELSLQQGDSVYALGAPKGLELSFTNGIVSSFRKSEAQFLIQTTAPIAPGSSGGPLFDHAGRVVGVTTSMISDAPGIYFSVGIGDVRRLLRTPQSVALPFSEWAKQQANRSVSESRNSVPSDEGPSFEETISWMYSFLEAHGQEWSGGSDASQSNFMDLSLQFPDSLRASLHSNLSGREACAVYIRHNEREGVQLHEDMKASVKTWMELMSLADIDARSVKVCARSHVCFETTNNLGKIVQRVPSDDKSDKFSEYDLDRGWIVLDSAENADRFANAFKHMVSLCGGAKSAF
jgi:S1-C subfamily serine protease